MEDLFQKMRSIPINATEERQSPEAQVTGNPLQKADEGSLSFSSSLKSHESQTGAKGWECHNGNGRNEIDGLSDDTRLLRN